MGSLLTRNEILLGAKLGQYEILRFIGQGGTASVFEARHSVLGKHVAIKILHEHLASDAAVAARFLREARITAQLRHPHAIDVLDVGEERGVTYLVMELLEGSNLSTRLGDHRALSIDEALRVAFPVAAALAHAHGHGIIHRDVKPANIFLARDARGTIVPKLVDFGISKLVDAPGAPPLTDTDVVMGTVLYMAPEQTMGGKFATAKSDQYSLAAVLYECLAGSPPFTTDGFYELLEAVRSEALKPPSAKNPRLPAGLDEVIVRALERDPAKRFTSVRAFAAALLPFSEAALADAWRRDFADSSSSRRSSATMKAVGGSQEEAPASGPRPREISTIGVAGIPRDVKIVERARPAPRAPPKELEWVVPFPKPRRQIEDAKHFRSTWITASQATLRGLGAWERYQAAIDPKHRDALLSAVAGVWMPMDVARAHYTACDTLGFSESELVEIGRSAMRRANATTLSLVSRMAQGVGVTPWTVLAQVPRLKSATLDDGFVAVARLGPKEARLEYVGYPLAGIRYNRVTWRGIVIGTVELFCQKAYVKEIPAQCDERSLVLTLSWV
ncbi:MAG: serine/threonine-protein kinase [Polyangiaceae bacterium]